MTYMTPKQDRVGARTVQDLERRINPTKIRDDIEAKTRLAIESGLREAGEDVLSYINVSSNVLSIKSDNFNLTKEGVVEAKAGIIGGCEIVDGKLQIGNANITEKLTADNIDATDLTIVNESTTEDYKVEISGGIISFDSPDLVTTDGQYVDTAIMQVTVYGKQYLLCMRSKVEREEGGWEFDIVPVGLVFRKSLAEGAGEIESPN